MGYAKIIDITVTRDGVNITFETDLIMGDLRKVRFTLPLRLIDFEVWKKKNPDGTLKQFVKMKIQEKYAEIEKVHNATKNLVKTEFTW